VARKMRGGRSALRSFRFVLFSLAGLEPEGFENTGLFLNYRQIWFLARFGVLLRKRKCAPAGQAAWFAGQARQGRYVRENKTDQIEAFGFKMNID